MYMPTYIISRFQGSRVSQLPSITDGQTNGRTDRPKPICPLNFSEVGGIMIVLSHISFRVYYKWYTNTAFIGTLIRQLGAILKG